MKRATIIARIKDLEGKITTEIEGDDQIDDNGKVIQDMATCGTCGFTWNDARISSVTPTPGARCPVEYEHEDRRKLQRLRLRLFQVA